MTGYSPRLTKVWRSAKISVLNCRTEFVLYLCHYVKQFESSSHVQIIVLIHNIWEYGRLFFFCSTTDFRLNFVPVGRRSILVLITFLEKVRELSPFFAVCFLYLLFSCFIAFLLKDSANISVNDYLCKWTYWDNVII